jgi:hypothetical protein
MRSSDNGAPSIGEADRHRDISSLGTRPPEPSVLERVDSRVRPQLKVVMYAALAVTGIVALYDTGARYSDFAIAQGGVNHLVESEIVFYFWYALWGTGAAIAAVLALMQTRVPERVLGALAAGLARPRVTVAVAALVVFASAIAFRAFALLNQAVADDEATYLFEAQTLLQGRLVNPLPQYSAYYTNQFIVLSDRAWYGQYPIGHPLLLALGELLQLGWLIVPLLGVCSVWLTYLVGVKLFEPKRAAAAACLLALSPQFVWTHATLLSQTSSACFMLLGAWALLRLQDEGRLGWACLAGLAWGFMLLIRPMPGVLLLGVALASHGVSRWRVARPATPRWGVFSLQLMAAAPGVALGIAGIALANYAESGSPFVSAYKTIHGNYGALAGGAGNVSNSFGGALVRQNFWLFGWTLSFAFLPFCRPRRSASLFWGMVAADYAYRLLVAKTVVGTTGPIYVFEAVPLLALASVDGALALAQRLGKLALARARAWVVAAVIASSLVGLVTFVPIEMRSAYLGSVARSRVFGLIERAGAERALIFANHLVMPDRLVSWAYFPPNPSPAFDDPFIFVRQPGGAGGPRVAYEFWKRQYPTRRAFLYTDTPRGQLFTELRADAPPAASASLQDLVEQVQP